MKRVLIILFCGWLFGGLLLIGGMVDAQARTAVGYKVKAVCSEIFVAGRALDAVLERDFERIHPLMDRVGITVDPSSGHVNGSLFGVFGRSEAVHRSNLGCALSVKGSPVSPDFIRPEPVPSDWAVAIDPGIQALVETARQSEGADIRAVVVVQEGRIVAEDYGIGFGPDRPMQSWSMAKSVTQALTMVAAELGYLSLSDRELMPGWTGDDPRADISLQNLLQMTDGLHFVEDYADPSSDVVRMLFNSRAMGASAAQSLSAHQPGTHWAYSSGTSNILSAVLRRAVEDAGETYHAWPHEVLFGALGMETAVFETDADGTFIGSSYLYASPRDWARLGQLYLNDGVWIGRRILPKSAVLAAQTPGLSGTNDFYGSHWWINTDIPDLGKRLPGLPETAYYMGGHDVQRVIVIPSKNAVIVRLGMTRPPIEDERDVGPAFAAIYDAL
ncbi:MAG: serine hydrolase [Pseudomonadota bacterium]